ncbi:MAG TPA: CsbD family protein [Chloroflexota bacterium]|nr:CsbD family protein [Chloroflexota bacterium]
MLQTGWSAKAKAKAQLAHRLNEDNDQGRWSMAGKIEKIKGKVKVAVGSLTGNKELETEGRLDRRAGRAKEKIGRVKNKVDATADTAERKAIKATDLARDAARHK